MRLRSLTKHIREQNWFAVALDFFIVVAGILIAFQITNWNEGNADRRAEYQAIERLISEYEQNLSILGSDKVITENTAKATEDLLSMIAPQPDPNITDKSIAQTLLDALTNVKFDPTVGATTSLLASGDINLIKDADIQSTLSQWQTKAQELIEWQEIERMHGEELILGETLDYIAWPNIDHYLDSGKSKIPAPSALESDYQGLFSSKRFQGLLNNRVYNTRAAISHMTDLENDTQHLIDRLKSRQEELK